MKFIDLNYKQFKTTDIARCLTARYTAAPTNHACENSGVLMGGEQCEDTQTYTKRMFSFAGFPRRIF